MGSVVKGPSLFPFFTGLSCAKSRIHWRDDLRRVAYGIMKRFSAILFPILILAGPAVAGADFVARVLMVHEGDRLTIHHQGRKDMVYLRNVDCPGLKQPYGIQARNAAAAYIAHREVVVRDLKRDRQGRMIADIQLTDGRRIAHELVKEGLAWVQPDGFADQALKDMEELARAAGKGLWAEPNPVPPWKWKSMKPVGHN